MKMDNKLLTTIEVASMLAISPSTVKRYADNGLLKYVRIGNAGHRRYLFESIEEYKIKQNNYATENIDIVDLEKKNILEN
jgi:excisionase family DNA binding protein